MTAEIAIFNRSSIALAADSAVTIGGRERVWKRTNKLFSLGPINDIGIMVFGAADFLGFPWEAIIKQFGEEIGQRRYDHVEECRTEFVQFLSSSTFSNDSEELTSINLLFVEIVNRLTDGLVYKNKMEFRTKLGKRIDVLKSECEEKALVLSITLKEFESEFSSAAIDILTGEIKEYLPSSLKKQFIALCFEAFRRRVESDVESGVVVAGFGKKEYFPVLSQTIVDGRRRQWLRQWKDDDIGEDLNTNRDDAGGTIIPFGQNDIAFLYLEGIGPRQLIFIIEALYAMLEEKSAELIRHYVIPAEHVVETALQRKDNEKLRDKFIEAFAEFRETDLRPESSKGRVLVAKGGYG